MLNLASNYSYKFIKDDVPVYMLTKRPARQYTPTHQMHFYTEPYLSRDNQDIRNALIGFVDEKQCSIWHEKMSRLERRLGRSATAPATHDRIERPFMYEPTLIHKMKLSEAKHISDTIRMPMMIVMDENGGNFDVFYYRHKCIETI